MKKLTTLMLLCCSVGLWAQINVRDFGAVGDGKQDDTVAIQKAIAAAGKKVKYERFHLEQGWYSGSTSMAIPEIFFPTGNYKISKTLVVKGPIALRGADNAVIIQTDPARDILYFDTFRMVLVENLQFDGGLVQMRFFGRNLNGSSIKINRCIFRNSASEALQCITRRSGEKRIPAPNWAAVGNSLIVPPYQDPVAQPDGTYDLIANDQSDTVAWFSSNTLLVQHSEFINCARAFRLANDAAMLEFCRIVANPATPGPVMISEVGPAPNMLAIRHLKAEAPETTQKQFWIQSTGFFVSCLDSEFRSVKPMLLLEQNAIDMTPSYSEAGNINIENCKFFAAGNPDNAVLYLYRLPNVVKFVHNQELSKENVPLIKWDQVPTAETIQNETFKGWSNPDKYHYIIGDNENVTSDLPTILKNFTRTPIDRKYRNLPDPVIIPENSGDEVDGATFGIVADNKTDNSAALTKALMAAQGKTLVLPTGMVKLASPVTIPPQTSIRGTGSTFLIGALENDLLVAPVVENLKFANLGFAFYKTALNLTLNDKSQTMLIDSCSFFDSSADSIVMKNAPGVASNHFQAKLIGNIFNGVSGIDSEANLLECTLNWFSNCYFDDNRAFFTIRGGTLVTNMAITIPYAAKGRKLKNTITGEEKIWDLGGNMRWVDNLGGKIFMLNTRAGGEGGGFCQIYNRNKGGEIYLDGGYSRMLNPNNKNCIVYLEQPVDQLSITALSGLPNKRIGTVIQNAVLAADGVSTTENVTISGIMTPR